MYNTDILIIGAGAVGTAIARELSKHKIDVMVVDKKDDVGGDASKSNNGCISTESSVEPFTLESRIAVHSKLLAAQLCEELEIPINNCGNLTIATTKEELDVLPKILKKAFDNNVFDVEYRTREEILAMEPNVNPDVLGGVFDPRTSHVDLFTYVIAQAENAYENGVKFLLDCEVVDIIVNNGAIDRVITTKGDIKTKWVINCAGLYCDEIAKMVGECDFTVHPRKGEFILLDRETPVKVKHIVSSVPMPGTRGMMLCPTCEGNIVICPTSKDLQDKLDKKTTEEGFEQLKAVARKLVPNIHLEDTITQFVGLRPAREPEGYHIDVSERVKGYVGISGIRSSGLTGSLGIAKYTLQMMREAGLVLERKSNYNPYRKGIVRFRDASNEERERLIKQDPLYGHIICRCETVTEAEIMQAIHRPLGARTIDAVKRRVRAGMGRCQGGFCSPRVMAILERELGMKPEEVRKRDGASYMLV